MLFDEELTKRLKEGDKKSFEQLFLATFESLCEYSMSITGSMEASENVVQDVFVSVWQNHTGLDDDVNVKAYLFHLVKNRSLDVVRNDKVRIKHQNSLQQGGEHDILNEADLDEDEELQSYLIRRVNEEVENLPEKVRVVFLLHRRDGLTYQEISQVLEISVKAVEARMSKALRILRDLLSGDNGFDLLSTGTEGRF